ncbi:S-layer homology domain-containing protein [Cohnella rhizosphaerae]|uniref:S-layer homology domain-containing protein n=1 Tax=Cohnella rhizosphaerae TaxID=1457232 RepID=A0A9X4KZQ4_9BACL|nr:S-layer homology domain-containing protein [Cohnella rhizosphaerae]MDG0813845.1 S-layer homology domain-containing protein [Cohnella rhizosphaerae]
MELTTDIAAPAGNGGAFAQQPVVAIVDAFGNVSTSDSGTVVTVSKKDAGSWTLTGTVTATANSGVVAFTGLGATNAAEVTGAQLSFDATGLPQMTSRTVTLPWPGAVAPSLEAVTAGDGRVRLAWRAGYGAVSYAVYQGTVPGIYGEAVANVTGLAYDATELTNGTTYYFVVKAVNPSGISAASNELSATPRTASGSTNPSTPTSTSEKPATTPDSPANPQPAADVFNSSMVDEADLVKTIESKIAEAKEANATADFADIQGHWAEKTIAIFYKMQVIKGYEDGTLRPNSNVTRAAFAVILDRVFGIQGGSNTRVSLKDIGHGWAKEAIERLVAAGVINGYEDGSFRPDNAITRQEMVMMLSRIVNLDNVAKDTAKGSFKDLNGAYAAGEIKAEAQAGIVSGKRGRERSIPGAVQRAQRRCKSS